MKLAKRVAALTPSATLEITAKAQALKAEGHDVIGLGAGEPDFNTPEHIKKAAEESIANNQQYDPDEILITNGVTESIYDLLTAVINLGDIMMALNLNQKNCRQYSISMAIKFECWL